MSQSENLVGAVGLIKVAGLEVTVSPLSQAEEMALDRTMRKRAEAVAGDHYTRCKGLLDALADSPADRTEALREIVRLANAKAPLSPAALFEFRCSPEGVAMELFARGKKGTPGLSLEGLRAVVTEANVDEVSLGLFELLRGNEKH